MSLEWFESFDAIPGVAWDPLIQIDRSKLRGADACPHLNRYETYDGKVHESLVWSVLGKEDDEYAETGQSPSSQHADRLEGRGKGLSPKTVAKRVSETLALPGTRSDYHFIILQACEALHGGRRTDPHVFGWIERLCLADISMMEQGPELVFPEDHWSDVGAGPLANPSVNRLASLYVHEGLIAAAVDLERRIAAVGGGRPIGEDTIARQQALLEEDGR